MFTKPNIKKSLAAALKNESLAAPFLAQNPNLKELVGKLCTEALYEYLNDNRVTALPSLELGCNDDLGVLGLCIKETKHIVKEYAKDSAPLLWNGRICKVGAIKSMQVADGSGLYSVCDEEQLYFTETGEILAVRERIYMSQGTMLLVERHVDNSIRASFSEIENTFPTVLCDEPSDASAAKTSENKAEADNMPAETEVSEV